MCEHVFKPLWYVCDDDYGITTDMVDLDGKYNGKIGHLVFCSKCGQVFVKEIAEKLKQ